MFYLRHKNTYVTALAQTQGHEMGVGGVVDGSRGLKKNLIYCKYTVQILYYSQCWFSYQSQTMM